MKPWAWGVLGASLGLAAFLALGGSKTVSRVVTAVAPRSRQGFLRMLHGEVGKDDGTKYWAESLQRMESVPKRDWCGAFVLWGLRKYFGVTWVWVAGKAFFYDAQGRLRLPQVREPQPGDIGYADNGYNHIGVVESVNSDGTITSVDGNSWMGQVKRNVRPRSFWAAFYSIDPLLNGEEPA